MKKMFWVFALVLLAAGTAYAQVPAKSVDCSVNGVTKAVKNAAACKALGGTVAEAKKKMS